MSTDLNNFLKTIGKYPKHVCPECGETFRYKLNFDEHMEFKHTLKSKKENKHDN